jgi:hypothetical protein
MGSLDRPREAGTEHMTGRAAEPGGTWMCEADRPIDALVQVKGVLRRVQPRKVES